MLLRSKPLPTTDKVLSLMQPVLVSEALVSGCLISYFIGSIPFGLIIGKCFGVGDIRTIGSGNIGATNMMRTGRKGLGVLTFLCDFLKGTCAFKLAMSAMIQLVTFQCPYEFCVVAHLPYVPICLFAVLGHIFPVWLKFKGGKGVATTLGVYLAISPMLFAVTAFIWISVFLLWRISSLSAIIAIGLSPIAALLVSSQTWHFEATLLLAILVITRHKQNIQRLFTGAEGNFRNTI